MKLYHLMLLLSLLHPHRNTGMELVKSTWYSLPKDFLIQLAAECDEKTKGILCLVDKRFSSLALPTPENIKNMLCYCPCVMSRSRHLQLMVKHARAIDTHTIINLVRNASYCNHEDVVDIIKYFIPNCTAEMKSVLNDRQSNKDLTSPMSQNDIIALLHYHIEAYNQIRNNNTLSALLPYIMLLYKGSQKRIDCYISKYGSNEPSPEDKKTALHVAINHDHLSVAQLLLTQYPDMIMAQDNNGQIPLFNAIITSNLNLCTFLLSFPSVQINIPNSTGLSALAAAAHIGNHEIITLLYDHNKRAAQKGIAPTYLMVEQCPWACAISNGDINNVRFLLTPLQFKDTYPLTPLHIATREHKIDIVRMLCEQPNADINAQDEEGDTALHFAAIIGNSNIADYLIRKNAMIDMQNKDGKTPLWWASREGRNNIVTLLLLRNAAIELAADGNITALAVAILKGNYITAETLLEYGANPNTKTTGAYSAPPIFFAIYDDAYDAVKLLLTHGASVNVKNKKGHTPLVFAMLNNHINIMELLLKYKANPNKAENSTGFTPLHYAAKGGNYDAVKVLLNNGALINAKDKNRWTALMIAAKNNHRAIIILLRGYGAKTHIQNKHGQKAIDLTSNDEIKELLTSKIVITEKIIVKEKTKPDEKCIIC